MKCLLCYEPWVANEQDDDWEIEVPEGETIEIGGERGTQIMDVSTNITHLIIQADYDRKEVIVVSLGKCPPRDHRNQRLIKGEEARIPTHNFFHLLENKYPVFVRFDDDDTDSDSDSQKEVYIGSTPYDEDSHSFDREMWQQHQNNIENGADNGGFQFIPN